MSRGQSSRVSKFVGVQSRKCLNNWVSELAGVRSHRCPNEGVSEQAGVWSSTRPPFRLNLCPHKHVAHQSVSSSVVVNMFP